MDYEKKIDIPFGTLDSELLHQEINIPDGFEATIEGNKVILKRKESEDERIRKALIDGFTVMKESKNCGKTFSNHNIPVVGILAWLEKQNKKDKLIQELGEYKVKYIQETLEKASTMNNKDNEKIRKTISDILLIDSDEIREILDANNVLMQDIDTWLEKQNGQKPVPDWMPKFLDELRAKKNYFDWDEHKDIEGYILAIINWMKPNYFNRKDDEHKPAWSKEDESWLEEMELMCLNFSNDTDYREKFSTWLKHLKDKVQPKQEWSEEDRIHYNKCLQYLESISPRKEDIKWFKSIRPKKQWRPSEKQINALSDVLSLKDIKYDVLSELLKDLKQL